jgi:5-methylcytosine-specific restriction protein B
MEHVGLSDQPIASFAEAIRDSFNAHAKPFKVSGGVQMAPPVSQGGSDVVPRRDLAAIHSDFSAALRQSRVSFGRKHDDIVRAFIAALATKRLLILTGLSGSGKTQIALRLGDWMGPGRSLVVPVRPDWTGAEALFGYEDALQQPADDGRRVWHVPDALGFMLEAAGDPDNPHLLVLDEMNLAHVERYFADVLSGMESELPCLPNLRIEGGRWRLTPGEPAKIPVPRNLFVVDSECG